MSDNVATANPAMDDELEHSIPTAPPVGAGATQEVSMADVSAEDFNEVSELGEPIPVGTYHFRLDSYTTAKTEVRTNEQTGMTEGGEPYYSLLWKCQEEPFVGRVVPDNVPWVKLEDLEAARRGDPTAKAKLVRRLPRAKTIMKTLGWTGTFLDFLATNPELRLTLGLQEAKEKGPGGKLIPTGNFRNKISRYLPLVRR